MPFASSRKWSTSIPCLLCADNSESDLEAAGIAPEGRTDPAFAGPGAKIVSYTDRRFHFGSGLIMAALSIAKLILCRSLSDLLGQSNASKTQVICAGVDLTFAAGADDVS